MFTNELHVGDILIVGDMKSVVDSIVSDTELITLTAFDPILTDSIYQYQQPIAKYATDEGNPALIINSEGNVGIGTTSPAGKLQVSGGNAIFEDNVGIGTTTPDYKLQVSNVGTGVAMRIDNVGNYWDMGGLGSGTAYIKAYEGNVSIGNAYTGSFSLLTGDTAKMTILNNGNVGIGTTGPDSKLDVRSAVGDGVRIGDPTVRRWGMELATGGPLNIRDVTGNYVVAQFTGNWGGGNIWFNPPGNLGIGTTGPGAKLAIQSTVANATHLLVNNTNPSSASDSVWFRDSDTSAHRIFRVTGDYDADAGGPFEFVINQGGNVGIGTTSPQYTLDVEGSIQAKSYYTGDIVFQKNGQQLWRMVEEEDGLYLESLKTGKTYRFILEEVVK
jgi:hypothetical protein